MKFFLHQALLNPNKRFLVCSLNSYKKSLDTILFILKESKTNYDLEETSPEKITLDNGSVIEFKTL